LQNAADVSNLVDSSIDAFVSQADD